MSDIQKMKQLIRTGKPLIQIAVAEHVNFNSPVKGFYAKLLQLAKSTRKIQKWEEPKDFMKTMPKEEPQGIVIPDGTTFEGTPKKVEIHSNHFRIYF